MNCSGGAWYLDSRASPDQLLLAKSIRINDSGVTSEHMGARSLFVLEKEHEEVYFKCVQANIKLPKNVRQCIISGLSYIRMVMRQTSKEEDLRPRRGT